ncbi:MAG: glycosyltransferase [Phycisphaerae bacterium]
MRIRMFYHSLLSDWNHGNAHFLRGLTGQLIIRGHDVLVYEPADAWSRKNLIEDQGPEPIEEFRRIYPLLESRLYDPGSIDLQAELDGADLIIVHEWNDPELVARIGEYRRTRDRCRLLFHDTHHRSVTKPEEMSRYDLSDYDGVLAFGAVIRDIYLEQEWTGRAWVFHEAADVRLFRPMPGAPTEGDLVWIGNWGDDERTEELHEFLLEPVRSLGIDADVFGVRYPDHAIDALAECGMRYRGWLANYRVPQQFAAHRVTVHVPRRPYVEALPGVPTIRPFEALACGIPLISAPWEDCEHLFRPGEDFLIARDGDQMKAQLRRLLNDHALATRVVRNGRERILARHTCGHRAEQLLGICREMGLDTTALGQFRTTTPTQAQTQFDEGRRP